MTSSPDAKMHTDQRGNRKPAHPNQQEIGGDNEYRIQKTREGERQNPQNINGSKCRWKDISCDDNPRRKATQNQTLSSQNETQISPTNRKED